MWVIFHKIDRVVVGLSALCEHDAERSEVIEEIVKGLVKPGKVGEYAAIQETDKNKAERYLNAFPEKLMITGTKAKPRLSIRDLETYYLYIKIDAPDRHPIDGIPEIPADGKSSTLITLQKINDRNKIQGATKDNEKIFLRTDYGVLRSEKGETDINAIKLNKGKAVIRLFSEAVKRVATIQLFCSEGNLRDETIQVEFI